MSENRDLCLKCSRGLYTKAEKERRVCKKCVPRDCEIQVNYTRRGRVLITESLFDRENGRKTPKNGHNSAEK